MTSESGSLLARVARRGLDPERWRGDLLRVVLQVCAGLGVLVYLPGAYASLQGDAPGWLVADSAFLVLLVGLARWGSLPDRVRAFAIMAVFYVAGAGLLTTAGSLGQVLLFAFSVLTTLLLDVRWGLGTVVLNGLTVQAVGMLGIGSAGLNVRGWTMNRVEWSVMNANLIAVDLCLVLALGAVIGALERALQRAIAVSAALQEERQALTELNASLRDSRALQRIAGRTARLGGWRLSASGALLWSDEVREIYGLPEDAQPTVDEASAFYTADCRPFVRDSVRGCIEDGTPFDLEAQIRAASGTVLWVRTIANAVRDESGKITHVHGSVQDITPQKRAETQHQKLETQLRQAQKMEAIGSLAGGIAHDFNNILSVILSYSDLVIDDLPPADSLRGDVEQIKAAGLRAAELTRQLLAFSRKQMLQPVVLDLNGVVTGVEKMLVRLVSEDTKLAFVLCSDATKVHADAGQLEQVIVNLVVNARDAMPRGGRVTIETSHVLLAGEEAGEHPGVEPGAYVQLRVTDTGTGMDRATQARIFEPFFTTKDKTKGTGLGLAMVYGIVQQSGGHVRVQSELGRGSTFEVFLPSTERSIERRTAEALPSVSLRGSETILLVEDDVQVREVLGMVLRKQGYVVLDVQNAGEAFLLCEQPGTRVDLLVTDVVMPGMSGPQLAERLEALRPDLPVLYISGYAEDAIVQHGVLHPDIEFLAKPVLPDAFARKVRTILDARRAPAGA